MNTTRSLTALLCCLAFGCDQPKADARSEAQAPGEGALSAAKAHLSPGERPRVIATTTMLADAARQIGGDAIEVHSIMRPGGDPHLYQPTPSDAKSVYTSHLVLTSGLHLEGWLEELVKNAGGERPVKVASRSIEPIRMEGSPGGVDPHFWFDLGAWHTASGNVTDALLDLVGAESEQGRAIAQRGETYRARIKALDGWTKAQLDTVPKTQRVLITSHDAFNYLGRAYDIDVVGIQGVSTDQAASQRDVVNIIETVRSRHVPTIFIESSINPALIEQVASETGVKTAGPLYSDSLGLPGSGAETYEGMIVENITQIVSGLGGEVAPFKGDPS